ncbi:MAG: acyl-CoA dehydratase activase [Ignavibacteria bacterium]|nr:acyl-CoA dehydratase activase [Ignavibacteria bacterium]
MDKKLLLGICIGASTISFVKAIKESDIINIIDVRSIEHHGNPKKVLNDYLIDLDLNNYSVVFTGRKFKNIINGYSIPEPEAIETAIKYLKLVGKIDVVASLGGENFIVYTLDNKGSILNVYTGNKCASGTGEFFLQQIGRMDLDIEEAIKLSESESIYKVSGRCSVFCKSDCTHALNKGIPKERVVSGLSKMIADKALELLSKQNYKNLLVIGGVSQNKGVIKFLKESFPNLVVPGEATYFESLGACIKASENFYSLDKNNIYKKVSHNFTFLPPLEESNKKVTFKELIKSTPKENDECILGLDVGSTTTKAVLLRINDNAILASEYLRTNGNPVEASIECYKSIREQISVPIKIIGLGTTGSGRHISALHALTNGIVNEIIAHAVAAAHFDKEVDTIFEIGGQDAKYTYLTNGIASDYAMNEACSAGTGSFLEEAAKESLNIYYKDIADIAFTAKNPINFNDQCSAFISSDIKTASHEGLPKEDIVAGLVYSICMNYVNRVKGNRIVGKKVFMQGGVCYNKAVPYAMANLLGKEIIVPPEPGLMGAFGVALEIKRRIELGLLERCEFDLNDLINRKFKYSSNFECAGGAEKCDRKCNISIIEVGRKKYPFGGACSKYYNERLKLKSEPEKYNLVKLRQEFVYRKYSTDIIAIESGPTIGISKSFLTNTIYPLYYLFFSKLDFKVVLSDNVDSRGADKIRTSYCYPVEIAHGLFQDLIEKNVDYIFLPHITQMDFKSDEKYSRLCVFVQAENYYLKSTFANEIKSKLLNPIIDFSLPIDDIKEIFVRIGVKLNRKRKDVEEAFYFAYNTYKEMLNEFKEIGLSAITELEKSPDKFAIVLFGRSYNAYADEANLNVPHKFASRNIMIIPNDFLPSDNLPSYDNMYWASGHQILRSARFVKNHKQLFGTYITNFSCGPDSFIIPYFRQIMGKKPSLTLELDSHSADVGIDTRIDAALDIIRNYIELSKSEKRTEVTITKPEVRIINDLGKLKISDEQGNLHTLDSNKIEVIIPSMGKYSSSAFSAVFKSFGIRSKSLPVPTFNTLKLGRTVTTCKECLPFILTTGSMLEYVNSRKNGDINLFFMPHGFGPCRQGQYFIMLKDIIKNLGLRNVAILTMNDEDAFTDFGENFFLKGWIALVISDVIHDIECSILSLAYDKENSIKLLNSEWDEILKVIEKGNQKELFNQLEKSASILSSIKLKTHLDKAKFISLIGEIYVRREEFSRFDLINMLIEKEFVIKTAPVSEYIYYSNYLIRKKIINNLSAKERLKIAIKDKYQRYLERRIKSIFSKSGLYKFEMVDIDKTMEYGKALVSEKLIGETILTTGLGLREIIDDSCGVVSIGPFNCIPSRVSDALLNKEMTLENKYRLGKLKRNGLDNSIYYLPFLYVETDGNPYPQITQSKIEIFIMQAEKLHQELLSKNIK